MARRSEQEPSASTAFLPARRELPLLRKAALGCTACDLHLCGTQTVFGEGPADAVAVFVGEQPGDREDRAGRPFVGPSGALLDEVLEEVGIPRERIYVTNAVKHFKNELRGKRRIHQKPNASEVRACRGWLDAELDVIKPKMIVCLGATAAQSFLGAAFRLTKQRGEVFETPWAPWLMATYHPSALLRMPDEQARRKARALFRLDLSLAAEHLAELHARGDDHGLGHGRSLGVWAP